ncbi:MAG: RNA polymerase sigma factor [Acidobacteria bacterium]|nr:MAG: RNA polymerase sigma factor [Acidobacteriota bacterium]REK02061.1 MAG: RNA polymerase sigma factor [Acidobacteriota bacterium]REK15019.1 MAG: RNA polymerase sigma factor [Acidobacteriota bacterium]REK45733.1 MAG: RNA polymerase sigma factor [Acidobacteriota bacterium]
MNLTSAAINTSIAEKREEDRSVPTALPEQVNRQEITRDTPDYELTQLSSEGDLEAFEMLYQKYHRRAYSLCLRMTNNVTEAEDLTQEAFIQLYRKAGSFRGDSAFTTWFHRLVVNQVLMHFRKRSVKNEKTTDDGEMPEKLFPQSKTKANLPILNRIDINKAIASLPPGYKSVFILHDVEGFEHSEVARILGISVGTSKSQLHKARLKLRGMLVR